MKQIITYLFFVFGVQSSVAQITFNVLKQDVQCNRIEFGRAEVFVTSSITPYTYLWSTGDTTSAIQNLSERSFSVVITDGLGADTTVNIEILLRVCEMIPEIIFTPNNDGINDTWFIQNSEFFPQAKIIVFNRLGQKVFQQNGIYEAWDGKDLFGVTVPDASYYYVVYHNHADEGSIIKGCISILK